MGTTKLTALRERFQRDGQVELQVRPWKVVVHLTFYVGMIGTLLYLAYDWRPFLSVFPLVFLVWFVAGVGFGFAEQLRGAGPALRIDRDGLTLRRWEQPLTIAWADIVTIAPYNATSKRSRLVGIYLPPSVWTEYRSTRPERLRLVDRLTHFNKYRVLVPFKALDSSANDILDLLDPPMLDTLTVMSRPPRLVLAPGLEGHGPLWFRGGREAPYADLALTSELRGLLDDWSRRAAALEAGTALEPGSGAAHDQEGRALAVHLQGELGTGAEVTAWVDL